MRRNIEKSENRFADIEWREESGWNAGARAARPHGRTGGMRVRAWHGGCHGEGVCPHAPWRPGTAALPVGPILGLFRGKREEEGDAEVLAKIGHHVEKIATSRAGKRANWREIGRWHGRCYGKDMDIHGWKRRKNGRPSFSSCREARREDRMRPTSQPCVRRIGGPDETANFNLEGHALRECAPARGAFPSVILPRALAGLIRNPAGRCALSFLPGRTTRGGHGRTPT